MALASAGEHYRTQRDISGRAKIAALGHWRGSAVLAAVSLAALQQEAASASLVAVEAMLAEQGIDAPPVGEVQAAAFAGVASNGGRLSALVAAATSPASLARIFVTQTADAGRVASGVSIAARPVLVGHVRMLTPPSCPRCAILAGRVYRWSSGFQRHPGCDCVMIPTTVANPDANPLTVDPDEAFRAGQIRGLSRADTDALNDGADMGRIVNIRSEKAGLQTAGGRVLTRDGKPTPEGIYRIASSRTEAIDLLRRFGYVK